MSDIGVLQFMKLSPREKELFISYQSNIKDLDYLEFLEKIFGDDFLLFLDLFAGENIKVPQRSEILKNLQYIRIYNYITSRGSTDDVYEKASKLFKRRQASLKRIVEKVSNIINEGE